MPGCPGGGMPAGAPLGAVGSGTWFETAGIEWRYINILPRSASFKFLNQFHGIGGMIGLPLPMCLPVRIALTKTSCDHAPRPVSESGVRFAE